MYCKHCNISYAPTDSYCTKCGEKLDILETPVNSTPIVQLAISKKPTIVQANFWAMPFFTKFLFILLTLAVFSLSAFILLFINFPEYIYNFPI